MKPNLLQRVLWVVILSAALVLGIFVAGAFLLLGLLLVPLVMLRAYWLKRQIEKNIAGQQQSSSSSSGTVIDGEVTNKRVDD